jgi:hypothetical protein
MLIESCRFFQAAQAAPRNGKKRSAAQAFLFAGRRTTRTEIRNLSRESLQGLNAAQWEAAVKENARNSVKKRSGQYIRKRRSVKRVTGQERTGL